MYGAVSLTRAQFDALDRLFNSLDHRSSISGVKIGTLMTNHRGVAEFYRVVTFESGRGNRAFHVDEDGNSAPVDGPHTSELVRA